MKQVEVTSIKTTTSPMVDQEDRFETFKTWFLHNGGVFGNHVDLQYKPARGFHLCTSSAIALQSSESIVSCPRSLTISSINAIEGNDPFVSRFENGPLPSLTLFCFFLVEQYQLGRLSFWWPYLSILPDPLTEHPFETPLYYDNGDMRWLRGTSLEHSARKMEESWRQQHLEGLRQLHQTHHHRYPWSVNP